MGKAKPAQSSSWEVKLQRRREFCERFVRKHHPEMVGAAKIKGARPLLSLGGPRRIYTLDSDWWLHTDDCLVALGFSYLGHLFDRHELLDHDWMIGRDDQEPWALVSEPYVPPAAASAIAALRQELEPIGAELLEYPPEQSTHSPGRNIAVLVANVISIHALAGAVARLIAADCPPLRIDDDEELAT